MKKFLCALMLTFFLITPIVLSDEIKESIINVDFSIKKELTPDAAKIVFYVVNSGVNLSDVKEKNDKTVSAAIAEIKKNLGENESVTTISYSINNIYTYKDKIKIFQKYDVKNGFEVKLKDLSKISKIVDIATQNGVKIVDKVDFYLEHYDQNCTKLMEEATFEAKKRAEIVAKAAGASLALPKNINPYCSASSVMPRAKYFNSINEASMDSMQMSAGSPETIEPGKITLSAGVHSIYYLK